ncbi:class I SAM-dependent methyltransferase [Janthinobacterium sp. JC611]|uniref:class I SAM-dependent methyltransferase n=1 Tax=Janthinobacterium sp. JC611 TaxID=2816201 RepID=UPI00333E1EED
MAVGHHFLRHNQQAWDAQAARNSPWSQPAAGAHVTVFDLSEQQLAQDRMVAERDGLQLAAVPGDMRDLACLADAGFDLIVHPVSHQYVPDIAAVRRARHRS